MQKVTYKIQVSNGNARISRTPRPHAHQGDIPRHEVGDQITFTSNDPHTVIKFPNSSPFSTVRKGSLVKLNQKKTFKVTKDSKTANHFACGYLKKGKFTSWGGGGGDTPGGY